MSAPDLAGLLEPVRALAEEAGRRILAVYEKEFEVWHKADDSPLTAADQASHRVIVETLQRLTPAIPILSEEGLLADYAERRQWQRYWLVDPLDGTKEFIKRNGEFTVNIALIDRGEAVLGAVYVPVQDVLYGGLRDGGAWKLTQDRRERIAVGRLLAQGKALRVVASRSHKDTKLATWIEQARQGFAEIELVS